MNCTEYGPWVSRYVDEDLGGKDLEAFLEHLSGCAECRSEVGAIERLRGWFQAADSLQGIPEMRGEWGLADLLRQEESPDALDCGEPISAKIGHEASEHGRAGFPGVGWIKRYLFPFPLPTQRLVRFALPLVVVALVATWFYARKTSDWIDVHELQPLPVATVAFPQEEGHGLDFFVMEHTDHQPWTDYGEELPMIEMASGPSR